MANPEHLAILKQGVEAWNKWRQENPDITPDLSQADLKEAHLERAVLINAHLQGAHLYEAHLDGALLSWANLEGAHLLLAHLEGADLTETNLSNANIAQIRIDRRPNCRGINAATCYGDPIARQQLMDQDYILAFKATRWGRWLYWPWLIFTDCGRSFLRWAAWSLLIAVAFALAFHLLGSDSFTQDSDLPWSIHKALYYSIVTFTTLGFGDITPDTVPAAYLVMAEVVTGYAALGLLISILANKVARRS